MIAADFVAIDSSFPQWFPRAFRNAEINQYFKTIENFSYFAMYPMLPDKEAWFQHGYGKSKKKYLIDKLGYSRFFPQNFLKIHYLNKETRYRFKLAYSFFLAETYTLLPFYIKNNIPFVFTLYPGGSFGLNNHKSDLMLKKIFNCNLFRGVITNQTITTDYLLRKELCNQNKICTVLGGLSQFNTSNIKLKKKNDPKKNLDICFVSNKYIERGTDKGYDLFIDVAKKTIKIINNVKFHVVGGFNSSDIDISSLKKNIKFYGQRRYTFLKDFYPKMDIFLSPNRPFKLYKGNFDGFPLGTDSRIFGVTSFVSNELKIRSPYIDKKEIVEIPLNSDKITQKIVYFNQNRDRLHRIGLNGQRKSLKLSNITYQCEQRIKFISKHMDIRYNR